MTWNIEKVQSLSRAEQSRAEQSRAEQSRAEQSRAEQSRAEQSRAEQSRAEQSIVVLGNFMDLSNQTYAGYRVYDIFGISPSICASGFKRDIFVLVKGNK